MKSVKKEGENHVIIACHKYDGRQTARLFRRVVDIDNRWSGEKNVGI
jgi:hypothetical protein